jgi:hypothetical protein
MTTEQKKPTYQLIDVDNNSSLSKPYVQLARVLKIQEDLAKFCTTEIRKTDFSNLNQIITTI